MSIWVDRYAVRTAMILVVCLYGGDWKELVETLATEAAEEPTL